MGNSACGSGGTCKHPCAAGSQQMKGIINWELIQAVRNGEVSRAKYALQNGADVDACKKTLSLKSFKSSGKTTSNCDGITPLMRASLNGCEEMMELLLNNGAAINAVDSCGWTALFFAAKEDNVELCKYLIAKGAYVHLVDDENFSFIDLMNTANHEKIEKWIETEHPDVYYTLP